MTLTRDVVLPPATAAGGGILAVGRPLPAGWERGIEAAATGACLATGEHIYCPTSPTEKSFLSLDSFSFDAFGIEIGVVCTTLGGERADAERRARAFQMLEAKAEYSVGYVLATGETQAGVDTGNPALADALTVGPAASAVEALGVIEDSIASNLEGLGAFVHVTPATLVALVAGFAVYRDIDTWRTPSGHIVVASPGYVGNIDGQIVATTEVFTGVGEIDLISTVDRTNNRYLAVHEAPALAVFDPCFNVSVTFDTSPTSP